MAAADIYPVKEGFYDSQCDHPWSYFVILHVCHQTSGKKHEKSWRGMLWLQWVQQLQQLRQRMPGQRSSRKNGE